MKKRKLWEEMVIDYPDEWLLISVLEWDNLGRLEAGVVERHSKDKEEVYRQPSLDKPTAFRYTGVSTFSGFRSHAKINIPFS